jgi:hypothetical protein
MKENRLYFKIEQLPNGNSQFHYFTGSTNNKNEYQFNSFIKTVNKKDMETIDKVFNNQPKQILKHMNMLEYLELLLEYENAQDGIKHSNKPESDEKTSMIVRLWAKFNSWFDENNINPPVVN